MADLFKKGEAKYLLNNKNIYLFGCSNMRGIYKDLIYLISRGTLIEDKYLKRKLESSYMQDRLVKHSNLTAGRDFIEERLYHIGNIMIKFSFLTRCWCPTMEKFLKDCDKQVIAPDVIIINSSLWDITRWGPNGVTEYKDNLMKLFQGFRKHLPKKCIVIWTTAPPLSTSCKPAFLVQQIEFLKHTLQFDIMEANVLAKDIVVTHGYDVLDVYHHLRFQPLLLKPDGVHWQPVAVRFIINLILTHISLSWNKKLPGRVCNLALKHCLDMDMIPTVALKKDKLDAADSFAEANQQRVVYKVERKKPYHKKRENSNTRRSKCKQKLMNAF